MVTDYYPIIHSNDIRLNLRKLHGFTLIELLIVVAVLGILGIVVLSSINPVEQINRGKDTTVLSTSAEIFNAFMRVVAIQSSFNKSSTYLDSDINGASLDSSEGRAAIDALEKFNEIKEGFYTGNHYLSRMFLTADRGLNRVSVCFKPMSGSFTNRPDNVYDKNGRRANCGDDCYTCIASDDGGATPVPQPSGGGSTPAPEPSVGPTPTPGDEPVLECKKPTPSDFTNLVWYSRVGAFGGSDYDLNYLIHALEWYRVENGSYPDCGSESWVNVSPCFDQKLPKYIPRYSTADPSGFPYSYIGLDKDGSGKYQNYCLAGRNSLSPNTMFNFRCPVCNPDKSYNLFRVSKQRVVDLKPYFGNVWPVVSKEVGEERDAQRKEDIKRLADALEAYKADNGKYPQIIPTAQYPEYSDVYPFTNLKHILYPKYISPWPVDPMAVNGYINVSGPSSTTENIYSVFEWNKDASGDYTRYCIVSYMDRNESCQNLCGVDNFHFYYQILSQSACYGVGN